MFPSARSPRRGLPLAVLLQALISAGDGLAMVALASRVYQNSHASWAVATVFLAITVPITALAPAAGVLLDRFPVRPVLIAASAAQTLVALALTRFTGTAATLGLAIGFGLCAAVLVPGLGVIVPQLAGRTGVIRANGYLQDVDYGDGRSLTLVSAPVQFNREPPRLRPAPEFGQHTDEVLDELGLSRDEIARL